MRAFAHAVAEKAGTVSGEKALTGQSQATWAARLREISGFALISVGVTGLLIPVIPGTLLIAAGVGVLGSDHRFVRRSRGVVHHWRGKLVRKGVLKPKRGPKAERSPEADI